MSDVNSFKFIIKIADSFIYVAIVTEKWTCHIYAFNTSLSPYFNFICCLWYLTEAEKTLENIHKTIKKVCTLKENTSKYNKIKLCNYEKAWLPLLKLLQAKKNRTAHQPHSLN